jgi:hypothetical protein
MEIPVLAYDMEIQVRRWPGPGFPCRKPRPWFPCR